MSLLLFFIFNIFAASDKITLSCDISILHRIASNFFDKKVDSKTLQEALEKQKIKIDKEIDIKVAGEGHYTAQERFTPGKPFVTSAFVLAKTAKERDELIQYYKKNLNLDKDKKIEAKKVDGQWQIALEDFLPDTVKSELNTSIVAGKHSETANCYNLALRFHNQLEDKYAVHHLIMESRLQKNFKEIKKDETLKPGDVLTIWQVRKEGKNFMSKKLLHAMVYMGGDIFFHKASKYRDTPVVFEEGQSILQTYGPYSPYYISFYRLK